MCILNALGRGLPDVVKTETHSMASSSGFNESDNDRVRVPSGNRCALGKALCRSVSGCMPVVLRPHAMISSAMPEGLNPGTCALAWHRGGHVSHGVAPWPVVDDANNHRIQAHENLFKLGCT